MSIRMMYGEVSLGLQIELTDYLVSVDINPIEIAGAIVVLKTTKTLADDAVGTYKVLLGPNLVLAGSVLTAYVTSFTGLVAETKYYIGVGIKIDGDSSYREVPLLPELSTLYFTQDIVRA